MELELQQVKSLSDLAYDVLLRRILSRELAPGSLLRERRVADELGMSRTPVREAISRLETEGLVTRDDSQLPSVKEISINEYLEALFIRQLLEPEAARLAAPGFPHEEAARLRDRITALMTTRNPTTEEHWRVDDDFHGTIARTSGNELLVDLIAGLRRKTQLFNLTRMPDRFLPGCQEHLHILALLEQHDADGARLAMSQHLDNVRLSILAELKKLFQ